MYTGNMNDLSPCPMCGKKEVFSIFERTGKYRYKCTCCGQYFEFNAPSQYAADIIYNEIICGKIAHPTDKGE